MEAETKTCCVTGHRDIPAEKMDFVKDVIMSYTIKRASALFLRKSYEL